MNGVNFGWKQNFSDPKLGKNVGLLEKRSKYLIFQNRPKQNRYILLDPRQKSRILNEKNERHAAKKQQLSKDKGSKRTIVQIMIGDGVGRKIWSNRFHLNCGSFRSRIQKCGKTWARVSILKSMVIVRDDHSHEVAQTWEIVSFLKICRWDMWVKNR